MARRRVVGLDIFFEPNADQARARAEGEPAPNQAFAQALGTRVPVSEKRIRRALAEAISP